MATIYYDDDADLSLIQGRKITVLGYGSQGHAHALSLRDSGCEVRVGLPAGSKSAARAAAAGLPVSPPAEACAWADVIMVLTPDTTQRGLYADAIAPNLKAGDALLFAHGFNIHFGYITPPADVDVAMIAPKAPGHLVRRQYQAGQGTPVLVAVAQDATGKAWDLARSYAAAIGGTKAGALVTTFKEETESDLFGEQAILCGGVSELVSKGFQTLVGLAGMWYSVSDTAEYGGLSRGPRVVGDEAQQAMDTLLADIQSGAFAREWVAEDDQGRANFQRLREQAASAPVEQTGRPLRKMMSWLNAPVTDEESA